MKVRIYCRDCTGQDYLGCFDGGTDTLSQDFADVDAAKAAGDEAVKDAGPWEYEVLDGDAVVFDSGGWL